MTAGSCSLEVTVAVGRRMMRVTVFVPACLRVSDSDRLAMQPVVGLGLAQ